MSACDDLTEAVLRTGLPAGARLVVAVSGGPDSIALLHVLHLLAGRPEHGWELSIGHVNHQLRGTESDEDEQFVRAVAAQLGVPVESARVGTVGRARTAHTSLEDAARQLRYEALENMRAAWGGDLILTAHTQDDQAETVVLHLLRGAGLEGLEGIHASAGKIVRPFLGVQRETVLAALQQLGAGYRLDRSNEDTRYARNRVRQEILPLIERSQPAARRLVARTAHLLQDDGRYLRAETERTLQALDVRHSENEVRASLGVWRALHLAMQRRVLRRLLVLLVGHVRDVEEHHVTLLQEALQDAADARVVQNRLPHRVRAVVDGRDLVLRQGDNSPIPALPEGMIQVPGVLKLPSGTLRVVVAAAGDRLELQRRVTVCGPYHALCDLDRTGTVLVVRSRRPGDRMQPLGMAGSRKLQDIMVDRRIPRGVRNGIPVVEGEGGIVWVVGLALDARVALSVGTERVVHLMFTPNWPDHHGRMLGPFWR